MILPRKCTVISASGADQGLDKDSRPLEEFRGTPAYVLLGDPGAGKTKAFEAECEALGEQACPIPARDFLALDPKHQPEWRGKTLFIDGLDEVRAGASNAHTPFDAIRRGLDDLGRPPFRLSCRVADWLGSNDRRHLKTVSPAGEVTVLRLDPLTDSDIERLLIAHPCAGDARAFIEEANRRGIGDLLGNPQSLDLLARAVAAGDWPESRKETFEMACREMVREPNDGHQTASLFLRPPRRDQLLDAAGHLCIVHLIAGVAGYTMHGKQDDEYTALDQCEYAYPERLRLVLGSRMLFKSVGLSDNRFTPIHRHIAEFLGARHLAQIISDRLPVRRVIALMTGEDGGVVSEMRGLSAWLAAHCKDARIDLIQRDPVGVGLYGDIRGFSLDEKRALLASLKQEGAWIDPWFVPRSDFQVDALRERAVTFAGLATPDMKPAIREILEDRERDLDSQVFVDFVLRVLEGGVPQADLSGVLLAIVRDNTRLPRVNTSALRAFMHHCPPGQDKWNELKRLLTDIHTGKVADSSNDSLLGMLLTFLYPDEVTPRELWSFYFKEEEQDPIGRLWWLWKIVESTSDDQLPALLDNLSERLSKSPPGLELRHLNPLALKLLARGLKEYGDQLDAARLYDWLGVGEVEIGKYERGRDEDAGDIRSWLSQRPEVQKAICLERLNRWPNSDDFNPYVACQRLYNAILPSDFGPWCLKQAVAREKSEVRVAEYLAEMAFYWCQSEGLSLEVLREDAQRSEWLKDTLQQRLASRARLDKQLLEHQQRQRTFTEEQRHEEEKWLAHVRSNEAALSENRAPPALLHQLAAAYFGVDSTNMGPAAVEEVLRGDQRLTKAVLHGFRAAVERQDVPSFEEILSLQARGSRHYLAWPFLAGLAEFERTAAEDASLWDDDRVCKALAFYYLTPLFGIEPAWYKQLLEMRPELVADVLVKCDAAEFRRGQVYLLNFAHLNRIWEPDHAQVLRHASLPLLRAFPIRCNLAQVPTLSNLLWAAIQYADRAEYFNLIDTKLSRASMNVAQRVYWLAAGFVVSSAAYENRLNDLVQGREKAILHLTDFLCRGPKGFLNDALETVQVKDLVGLVGARVSPVDIRDSHFYTPAGYASGLVKSLIQELAISPDKDASRALGALLKDPALSAWRDILSQAQDTQRVIRRDANYRHPTVEQVCQTLKAGTPANPGDLAALVVDRLEELAVQIRNGNSDAWRQYWNVDQHGRPKDPRPENSCRDILLTALQQRLRPHGVDTQREVQHANDKRADIGVSYGDFEVPIETKRNMSGNLWRAMREQLMTKYVTTPETGGYGIYLVFWFGKQCTAPSDSGKRPADGEELQERLTMKLTANERRKISVRVIDVSRP